MRIGFLGGGNMASALIGGLIAKGADAASLSVAEVSAAARERLAARYRVHITSAPDAAVQGCEVLVLAVKPQDAKPALDSVRVGNQLVLSIRTQSDPLAMLPAVRRTIASLDPMQPVYMIRTLDDAFAEAVSQRRAAMLLITIFAGVALVLAAVGIYGLMSYMVNERTHEIGIRMALGAAGGDVLGLVVRQTVRLVVIGAVLGLAGAIALGRALTSLVFEVRPSDPATLTVVTALLMLVALAATLVPAMRATRVTPLVALRRE